MDSVNHWLDRLIEEGRVTLRLLADQHALQGAEIRTWVKEGHLYAPAVTLGWFGPDEVSRNIHVAAVADDGYLYREPTGWVVVQTNAWFDESRRPGLIQLRRSKHDEIGRVDDVTPDNIAPRVNEVALLAWQAYGAVSQVRTDTLRLEADPRPIDDSDPGPLRVDVWRGE